MKDELIQRFLRYVKIDTRSKMDAKTFPSTEKQFNLARLLKKELEELGLEDVELDENCYLMATLPSTIPDDDPLSAKLPIIGFLAHIDTSPDVSGENVKPQFIPSYDGGDIVLPGDSSQVITVEMNPPLKQYVGKEIITTDGTTLLGADDKAGVAEIMTALSYLKSHPEFKHGKIRVAFTPDEEVGKGTEHFDVGKFGCDFAYTLDGGELGQVENENFNAAMAVLVFKGRNVHPGYAKDKLFSSMKAASYLVTLLPTNALSPETTEQREGYLHPISLEGNVEKTTLKILLRDFELDGMRELEAKVKEMVETTRKAYPKVEVELEIKESYKNMKIKLDEKPEVVGYAVEAVRRSGVEPKMEIIRGGTDGARLCFMGLPTPNIFAGGHNFHSKLEWAAIPAMEKAVETILNILRVAVEVAGKGR